MLDRRTVLGAGLGAGLALAAGPRLAAATSHTSKKRKAASTVQGDESARLQAIIDNAASAGAPVELEPRRYRVAGLRLPAGLVLAGVPGRTILQYTGGGTMLTAEGADGLLVDGILVDGAGLALDGNRTDALLSIADARDVRLRNVQVHGSLANGISLRKVAGAVTDCRIRDCGGTAIQAEDSAGLEIAHNHIADIGNNGIQVVRSAPGEDGTILIGNRIERIFARLGGLGQYGNGINVFRAGSVIVSDNRIADCAWSAIRNNAGANVQILGNSCERSGEVAIYAEFAAEGAVISGNLVDKAAMGISVANFDEGRRLSVIQGNLIRNLFTRPQDEQSLGVGIGVEADAAVSGNVVEGAPAVGILIGWGRYQRDVAVTGNVVRLSGVGIGISAVTGAGSVLISGNLIAGAGLGAVRAMDHARPIGPELAGGGLRDYPHITVLGSVVT